LEKALRLNGVFVMFMYVRQVGNFTNDRMRVKNEKRVRKCCDEAPDREELSARRSHANPETVT